MESLSWIFFCLSPFALFCSEDGNGLILCPIFIILGFVFKYIGSNSGGTSKAVVKVEPQEFWEWHYRDRMRSTFAQKDIGDYLMSAKDKEARDWATTICGYHNAWVPPEAKQEEIARASGAITEKMIKERNEKKDRIQIGKYFLMNELKLKYEGVNWRARKEIEKDMRKIKILHHGGADDWYVKQEYGKTVSEMWKTLLPEEKQEAENWVREYEEKLVQSVQNYEKRITCIIYPVKMDF